ncbi:MAG TPA: DUF3152 domain-containing protein [Actinopolymorphaceae bacterium]
MSRSHRRRARRHRGKVTTLRVASAMLATSVLVVAVGMERLDVDERFTALSGPQVELRTKNAARGATENLEPTTPAERASRHRRPRSTPSPRTPEATPAATPKVERTPSTPPRIPEHGSGTLKVVSGNDRDSGEAPRNAERVVYRLEMEAGLPFDGQEVAEKVQRTLTDPRGWQKSKRIRFQRVDGDDYDFRIILATPDTTDDLCAPLDTGGEVSCRQQDRVVLNAKRWAVGVPDFGGDVDGYRSYLVNHEVGHALGEGHSACTDPGGPAPVMMQQTKGVGRCLPNPWPEVLAR